MIEELWNRGYALEAELVAKGYPERTAAASARLLVNRCIGTARELPSRLQQEVALELFESRRMQAEQWCLGVAEARARGDYATGMARAQRDDRYREGLERFLGEPPGPQTVANWHEEAETAITEWEKP